MLASALAPLTSKIELMVAVHPGIITPQVVAKFATSLDRVSGGRAAINIVNGWWKEEFETFGNGAWPQDDDARYRRMDEFVRVMRGLWNEDAFDFHGEFYTVDRQGLPLKSVRLPNPPLYAGSRHDPGKDVIARDCDCWFVDCLSEYRLWEQNLAQAAVSISDMNTARSAMAAASTTACRVTSSAPIRRARPHELANSWKSMARPAGSPSSLPRRWDRDWSVRPR